MIKLIFSDSFDPVVETGASLMTDSSIIKRASEEVFRFDYDKLKPDKDHVGIHLVALGDFETYGSNRNGDGFPKKACINYHNTFVKHAHPFRHHKHNDPKTALGIVKASAYNEDMGRIELFIHAHKDKAEPELTRMEKEGTIPFSMAAKVAYDRCDICNAIRKTATDPNQCEHIRDNLGRVFEDGKVACTLNDEPKFFDISFVNRPADRIAWDLKKVAGYGVKSSLDLASEYDIALPLELVELSKSGSAKLALCRALADIERINTTLEKRASLTESDRFIRELRKAAAYRATDTQIEHLRQYEPKVLFNELGRKGIILDSESFFKYAFGPDYGELASDMPAIIAETKHNLFSDLVKTGQDIAICDNSYFDLDSDRSLGYITNIKLANYITRNLVEPLSLLPCFADRRVIESTINGIQPEVYRPLRKLASSESVKGAAHMYAAYKLSALSRIVDSEKGHKDRLLITAAVHNTV